MRVLLTLALSRIWVDSTVVPDNYHLAVTPLLAAVNMGDFAVIFCVAMSCRIYTHFVE